jgi:hypothetical protein
MKYIITYLHTLTMVRQIYNELYIYNYDKYFGSFDYHIPLGILDYYSRNIR